MILLDTNVVSELMRRDPNPQVIAWLDDQPAESVWTTAMTLFEVRTGLELLPPSRRRGQLEQAFDQLLAEDLDGRVQSFDQSAAHEAGRLAAERQRAGRPLEVRDIQIAGITAARRAKLATRNFGHFGELGIEVVDPWTAR